MKTYIINLKESVQRRESVLQATSAFPFLDVELIEAVNGKLMTQEDINHLFDTNKFTQLYGRFPVKGEIGCTLSHRVCYERLLASNEQYALILEDDISFTSPKDVELVLNHGVKLLQERSANIVLFVHKVLYYSRSKRISEKYKVYPVYMAFGTHCYLVDRKSAERLLSVSPIGMIADDFKLMRQLGIRIKCIYPSITTAGDMGSVIDAIEDERCKAHRGAKFTFMRRLKLRTLYRLSLVAIYCGILVNHNYYKETNLFKIIWRKLH